jgi:hypothetical protein
VAVVALGCGLLSACDAASASPLQTVQPTSTSETALKAQQQAIAALQAWLLEPSAGSITVSSVEFDAAPADSTGSTETARELTGVFDPYGQTASLSGTSTLLSHGSTDQTPFEAAESGGWLYTTIASDQTADDQGGQWLATDLSNDVAGGASPSASASASASGAGRPAAAKKAGASAKPSGAPAPSTAPGAPASASPTQNPTMTQGSTMSPGQTPDQTLPATQTLWWKAFQALDSVTIDGPSEVNTKSAIEFTGTVDLGTVPGIPQALLNSPVFQNAGTDVVSIDLYTDLATKALVRVTYRIGLDVSVDATATATSTAGYEVDLSGFGQTETPSPSPTVTVPDPQDVVSDGNDELCYLLPF